MSVISESENEIRAVISGWLGSVASGDAGSIAGIYAEDGRILVAGSPVSRRLYEVRMVTGVVGSRCRAGISWTTSADVDALRSIQAQATP